MKSSAKRRKTKKKIPDAILAARIANREIERMTLGDGFHSRTHQSKNKKHYTRKAKHKTATDE